MENLLDLSNAHILENGYSNFRAFGIGTPSAGQIDRQAKRTAKKDAKNGVDNSDSTAIDDAAAAAAYNDTSLSDNSDNNGGLISDQPAPVVTPDAPTATTAPVVSAADALKIANDNLAKATANTKAADDKLSASNAAVKTEKEYSAMEKVGVAILVIAGVFGVWKGLKHFKVIK